MKKKNSITGHFGFVCSHLNNILGRIRPANYTIR